MCVTHKFFITFHLHRTCRKSGSGVILEWLLRYSILFYFLTLCHNLYHYLYSSIHGLCTSAPHWNFLWLQLFLWLTSTPLRYYLLMCHKDCRTFHLKMNSSIEKSIKVVNAYFMQNRWASNVPIFRRGFISRSHTKCLNKVPNCKVK